MNPLTNMKNVTKLSEHELKSGGSGKSWHDMYRDSAWIFIGGLPFTLTEGDVVCVFSQYGEVVNVNLVRDKSSGKSKGFCFLCYEDQRSTILAVDNLNGIKILGRSIRVDHVSNYKPPKENDKMDEETLRLHMEGCAPKAQLPVESIKKETLDDNDHDSTKRAKKRKKEKKEKKEKKKHKKDSKKKKKRRKSTSSSSSSSDSP